MQESHPPNRNRQEEDPVHWVAEHGDRLYRYAFIRTGNREIAEDLVQETFLAATRGRAEFRGECSTATWLTSILQRKVADHFRAACRQPNVSLDVRESDVAENDWRIDPTKVAQDREFWEMFMQCVRELPETLASAYVLRDIEGEPPKIICEILEISPTNLSMRLRRARLAMRDMLERRWFTDSDLTDSDLTGRDES